MSEKENVPIQEINEENDPKTFYEKIMNPALMTFGLSRFKKKR